MMISAEELAGKIRAKTIAKDEALSAFEQLSPNERWRIVELLKDEPVNPASIRLSSAPVAAKPLKAIDQRELEEHHRHFIAQMSREYENRVPQSKKNITKHQKHFVDQRRPFHLLKDLKSMHFQITYKKADGAHIVDIDDNKYIDISGDMGVNIFGHKPAFVLDAVKAALDQGIPLAGYSEKIFETTKLFSEITGHERVLFTQSGTESVMFAVRIARAATGKRKLVVFDGAYHGLSDTVVAVADMQGNSVAMGPGMLQSFADEIIVLEYGDPAALETIAQRADEIACVLVEPVQSRNPYKKPVAFLKEIRHLTLEKNIPLIFDEMITGFRVCPRGAQGVFNIKPDISTYGKIPGGGLPTGVIAGSAKYMDYVDGGEWQLDDESMPKSKRTGMAGTHTQNPLKIASAHAILTEIKKRCEGAVSCDNCSCFQKSLNQRTQLFVDGLNQFFLDNRLPIVIDNFGSLFRFRFVDSMWGVTEALFFLLLRMNGVETNIQGNCFFTTAHTDEDIEFVALQVKSCLKILLDNQFFVQPSVVMPETAAPVTASASPIPIMTRSVAQPSVAASMPEPANSELTRLKTMLRADFESVLQDESH